MVPTPGGQGAEGVCSSTDPFLDLRIQTAIISNVATKVGKLISPLQFELINAYGWWVVAIDMHDFVLGLLIVRPHSLQVVLSAVAASCKDSGDVVPWAASSA